MSHRNARTTYHARLLIVQRYQAGWAKAHIAEAMGISRKCVHTWVSRFEAQGKAGLNDRSCRPHTLPTRTCGRVEKQILAWNCIAQHAQCMLDKTSRSCPWRHSPN